MMKNFVAAAVFSVSYFLNVVEDFRSCLSKFEGSVCHFGLSIGRAVMTSHSRCAKDSASCDTKFVFFANIEHRVRKPRRDFRLQTSDFRLQTSDFRLQTSDFRLQTSDFRLQTSDFRLQTSVSKPFVAKFNPCNICLIL